MNILVDVRLLARGGTSGIEAYTSQIVSHLLAIDPENTYRIFYNGVRKKPLPDVWKNHPRASVINWRLPNKLLDLSSRFFSLPPIDRVSNADLVFSPHFNILSVRTAPRVITFHDLSFIHHPDFFGFREHLWHWLQVYRTQAHRATRLIANSAYTKEDLAVTLGIPREKITTIYPGVDANLKKLPPNDPELLAFRERHHLDFPYVLYLGTLEPRKNVEGIIRAFNLLKRSRHHDDFRLIIAGRPGWLYQTILKEVDRSPYRDSILLWGQVRNEDKIFLYNAASLFVYPSFFEGFGFPPLEAQRCGCPVIVANRTSLPEVVGDAAILINPWNTMELVQAMGSVLESRALRDQLIRGGFANAARFSWEKAAAETLKTFYAAKNQ